jgi:hypothetical protein
LTKSTEATRAAFFAALSRGASVTKAAEGSGLTRQRWYQLKESDPEVAAGWANAEEEYKDRLHDILWDWITGQDELKTVTTTGGIGGTITRTEESKRRSEKLFLEELRRLVPEFREQTTINVQGSIDVNATVTHQLADPLHQVETFAVLIEHNPAYAFVQRALPLIQVSVEVEQARRRDEQRAIEGEARPAGPLLGRGV